MFKKIQQALFRAFVFSRSSQLRVLSSLQVQLKAGLGVAESFGYQKEVSKDHQVRRVADMALSAISTGRSFASLFATSGYYSLSDARLLEVAERNGALIEIIDLMQREADPEESFASTCIVEQMQWIFGLIAMIAITMYGVEYERMMSFGGGPQLLFFAMGHWLNAYFWWLVGGFLAAYLLYRRARFRVVGNLRLKLREIGIFGVHDRQQIIRLLELLVVLFRNGVPQREAVEEALSIQFTSSSQQRSYLAVSLRRCLNALRAGQSVIEGMDYLLSDEHTTLLLLQAGRGTPDDLAKSMAVLVDIMRHELRGQLKIVAGIIAAISALGAFAFLVPMINVLMGAGFQM